MMSSTKRIRWVVLGAGACVGMGIGVAGCSGGTAAPTVTVTVPAPVPTSASASASAAPEAGGDTDEACGPESGAEAAAAGIAALAPPAGLEGVPWDAAGADYSGYDPCAALSWSVVTIVDSTGSSPNAVLLFHDGSYLGTATSEQYGFTPAVERVADDEIAVAYRFLQGNESTAEASGRADATFTWNDETGRVDMTGDVPPTG